MKQTTHNLLILLTQAITTVFVVTVFPVYSQDNMVDIVDRAGFRRPTDEMLQLEGQLRYDVETRISLGLKADVEYVRNLRGSAEDVASAEFNVPMTQAEYDDMQERWAFASAAHDTIIPYVQNLPVFAGVYFDHSSNGDLVILLTEIDTQLTDRINFLTPGGRATRIEIVSYTEKELRDAVRAFWEIWATIREPEVYEVAVDVPANAIRIQVDHVHIEAAERLISEISPVVGVPLFVVVGERVTEAVCNHREDCHSPMRAGIVIRRGTIDGPRCTMGFHIQSGSSIQFVTAGHCSYNASNNWYHQGYGYVGNVQSNLYSNNGMDIMRVEMNNGQASSSVYGSAPWVSTADWPTTGMWVCASLGTSDSWSCGTVSDSYTSWYASICNCIVYGGRSTISGIGGDSGSPCKRQLAIFSHWNSKF
jgi:hypothetical protein